MEIHLKINDVIGMDDEKRHIIRVDCEEIRRMLKERKIWEQLLENPDIRNTIYMQEKAKREDRQERKRQRIHSEQQLKERREEAKRQRQNEQFMKSMAYRRSIDFYRDILGIENESSSA